MSDDCDCNDVGALAYAEDGEDFEELDLVLDELDQLEQRCLRLVERGDVPPRGPFDGPHEGYREDRRDEAIGVRSPPRSPTQASDRPPSVSDPRSEHDS